ncbi:MAG: diguanylate cyclase (GGDEF)-like protein [Colwellia sp.]|uniref:CHASE domain-containing protein n=1 Tax=unclassified Colwellia TaxID=196834 RepID=UPI001C7147BA|nr:MULTISPECIES: CHASE domain-containing protein [unclassified Colwellia]
MIASFKIYSKSFFLSLLILISSLTITYIAFYSTQAATEKNVQIYFDFRVREAIKRIENRVAFYKESLRGIGGLFKASTSVSRDQFKRYTSSLNLEEHFPGIQGVGFSILIPSVSKNNHIDTIRREGFPDYSIYPEGKREVYSSIIYLEPFSDRNLWAFGYDMFSEEVRKRAMQNAIDNDKISLSGKVRLVQESGTNEQAGFLMYLPIYERDKPHTLITERRENIVGWVYSVFRMNDFMKGVHGEYANDLDLDIFDGDAISYETLMFDSNESLSLGEPLDSEGYKIYPITVVDHAWTVRIRPLPTFNLRIDTDRPIMVALIGSAASLALTLIVWLLLTGRSRALHDSLHDSLTGLPNRKLFIERLQQALLIKSREKRSLAILFIDLDKFKPVNDSFGHIVGDLTLSAVAQRIEGCLRKSDTVARIGGDEFIVLLPTIRTEQDASEVSKKICHALSMPFEFAKQSLSISSSIGVAIYPEHGSDETTLIKNADTAMYYAKTSGRNNVKIYKPSMNIR